MKHLEKLFSIDKNDSHPFVRMEGALECRISDVRLWKLLQQNIHLQHKNREIYKLKPYEERAKGVDVMRNHCAKKKNILQTSFPVHKESLLFPLCKNDCGVHVNILVNFLVFN